jgi:hypothetical protein
MTEPTDARRFYPSRDARFTVEGGHGGVVADGRIAYNFRKAGG